MLGKGFVSAYHPLLAQGRERVICSGLSHAGSHGPALQGD